MSRIPVISPSGKSGSIPAPNLHGALGDGFKLAYSGERIKVVSPGGKEGTIPTPNLQGALGDGFKIAEKGWDDRAKEVGQGIASGLGGLSDVANKYVAAPVAHGVGYAADLASQSASNMGLNQISQGVGDIANQAHEIGYNYQNSNAAETLPQEDILQTNLPSDKTSEVLKAAGGATVDLLPFSAAGKGVQLLTKAGGVAKLPWVDKLNKFLTIDVNASNAASFAGMGAGAELAKSDDPNTNVAENAAREIVGGIVGGTVPHASMGAVKGIWNAIVRPLETAKEVGTTLLAETTGGKINKEAVEAAKKLGLHLPPSLATDSNLAKGIENTALKSIFSSKAYNEVIENIPQGIIKEIDRNLDEIGTKTVSSVASDEYKTALQSQSEIWQQESKSLFDNALKSLTENDVMGAPKTLEIVRNMRDELSHGIRAPEGTKKALIDDLTQLESRLSNGNVSVRDLIAEQQDLSRLGKYGDTEGLGNFYNGIAGTITDELATYKGNKAFTENYMPARAFYKENIINKLRTDTAKSILQELAPKEAFAYMSTPTRISELERILGNHKNAKEIIGSLKRAKISQVLSDKNVIDSKGSFNSEAFIRLFGKESKELLLKSLMGENYNKVQANIMPIANAITSSKKVLANPSGTANVLKDYSAISSIVGGVGTAIATGSGAVGAATAAGGATAINLISRAFASPEYLEKLIARSKRNERLATIKQNPKKELKDIATKKAGQVLSKPSVKYQAINAWFPKKEEKAD